VVAHVLTDAGPHGEQHALALVVARAVLVRLTEISGHYRAVDRADDLAQGDLFRRSCENITAPHAALGTDEPGAFEREQDLLQVGLRKASPLCDVADRSRRDVLAKREGEQSAACVVPAGRYLHGPHRTAAQTVLHEMPPGTGVSTSARPCIRLPRGKADQNRTMSAAASRGHELA
jgi:hypothetical protein